MTRPKFLDQPSFWQRSPRVDQSMADYANPIHHQPSERSWIASDIIIAVLFVVVSVWIIAEAFS